jgi:ABC-type phosphate transport system substrate-binding protein
VRSLYIYAVKTKDPQTNLIGAEFLRFLVSREGQMKITAIGFIPIDRDSQEADLRRLRPLSARR